MAKILGVHIPLEPKNLAINGAMDFWQRVEAATTTVNTASSTNGYTADMFSYVSTGTTVKNYSIVQSSTVPTLAQSGFQSVFSYLFTMVTGIASPAAGDAVVPITYKMEGADYERIHSKTVTFGFWTQASISGTYSFALQNSANNRSYVTTFTVSAANTWQFIPITVTLDNTGTYNFGNGVGLIAYIGAVSGTTFQTSTLGSWQAGNLITASTGTNWQATTGATFYVTQFSIVEGSLGFGALGFLRAGKNIQQELALCQRYYEKSYDIGVAVGTANANGWQAWFNPTTATSQMFSVAFKTTKRIDPTTITLYSGTSGASGTVRDNTASADVSAVGQQIGTTGYVVAPSSSFAATNHQILWHWIAEAGL